MGVRKTAQRLMLLALLMLSLFGLRTLRSVWAEKTTAEARLRQVEKNVAIQTVRNERLTQRLQEQGQESETERIGREELFLVYPEEKIIVQAGN